MYWKVRVETAAISASVFSGALWLQSKTKRNKYWYDSPFLRTNNSSIKKQTAVSACLCKGLSARHANLVAWVFHKHSASAATCSKLIALMLLAIKQRSKRWTRSIYKGRRHKVRAKSRSVSKQVKWTQFPSQHCAVSISTFFFSLQFPDLCILMSWRKS